jgi:predicted SnoaL-like aldol condensation-catalyzing enzyme
MNLKWSYQMENRRILQVFAAAAISASLWALPVHADEATEAANLELVTTAYQALFGDHDLTALTRYWAEDYIQHNPTAPTGRDGLQQFLASLGFDQGPKTTLNFLRTAADGDLVWLYSVADTGQGDTAIIDIFRVENGLIAEHWDVMQAVPATTMSGNSFSGDLR